MKKWTKEEINRVQELYYQFPMAFIATLMGLPYGTIKGVVRRYGLKTLRETRFNKGHRPWNTGIKGWTFKNSGQFPKGNIPQNYKEPGYVAIRRDKSGKDYWFIKSEADKTMVPLHRYLWLKHVGKIPDGMILRFKDGNTLNCDIDNLELITRAEHMKKNTNRKKSSESMLKLYRRERLRILYELPPLTGHAKRIKTL